MKNSLNSGKVIIIKNTGLVPKERILAEIADLIISKDNLESVNDEKGKAKKAKDKKVRNGEVSDKKVKGDE